MHACPGLMIILLFLFGVVDFGVVDDEEEEEKEERQTERERERNCNFFVGCK
jgi:hypothetical protein